MIHGKIESNISEGIFDDRMAPSEIKARTESVPPVPVFLFERITEYNFEVKPIREKAKKRNDPLQK